MTIKVLMILFVTAALSGCSLLHDGGGWEHNMNQESNSILEHQH